MVHSIGMHPDPGLEKSELVAMNVASGDGGRMARERGATHEGGTDVMQRGHQPEMNYGTGEHLGEDPDDGAESTYGYISRLLELGRGLGQRVLVTLVGTVGVWDSEIKSFGPELSLVLRPGSPCVPLMQFHFSSSSSMMNAEALSGDFLKPAESSSRLESTVT
ncbi:c6 transcription [Moniliophthora roreri]|nr:c6 transcription [Moniliophthora roreri]